MNGWALGALICIVYTLVVGGLALKKSPGLIKLAKLKLGKRITDKAAVTISMIMAVIVGLGGVVLFIIGATK